MLKNLTGDEFRNPFKTMAYIKSPVFFTVKNYIVSKTALLQMTSPGRLLKNGRNRDGRRWEPYGNPALKTNS